MAVYHRRKTCGYRSAGYAASRYPAEGARFDGSIYLEHCIVDAVQTYEAGAAVSAPEYTVPEGHSFSGWEVPETMPAENLVLDAILTINVYDVTLIDGTTGDIIAVLHVEHGQDAVLPDAPDHIGYIFDRWEGDAANVTEARTITALYCMIGDVNNDGEITACDALLIMRYALGLDTEASEPVMDFNGDGRVSLLDALLMLRRSIGVE